MPSWVLLLPVVSWLLLLTAIILDLTGVIHRGTGIRCQLTGLLLMNTAMGVSSFAHHHGWRISQLIALDWATGAVLAAGIATGIVGVVIQLREPPKARRAG